MKNGFLKIGVLIVFIISIIYILMKGKKVSRGIRNNNPFNLNKGHIAWNGEIEGTDPRFSVFVDMKSGIRAGLINLYKGYFARGLTLRAMINKYAPASDNNDVDAYIKAITKWTGVGALQVPVKAKWLHVAWAILYHENGMQVKSLSELEEIVKVCNLTYYL